MPLSAAYSTGLGGGSRSYGRAADPGRCDRERRGHHPGRGAAPARRSASPELDGGGQLVKPKHGEARGEVFGPDGHVVSDGTSPIPNLALGVLTICSLFVLGTLAAPYLHCPRRSW